MYHVEYIWGTISLQALGTHSPRRVSCKLPEVFRKRLDSIWAPNIVAAYMYVSPVNKTAKNKNVTTKTLKNALFCPAGTTYSFDTE